MRQKQIFKFLDPYLKEDKNYFFGREKETYEVFYKLGESKLLLLYGASGTGKTSILNCGVANMFDESDWFPIEVRRKNNIIKSLSLEIEKILNISVTDLENIDQYLYSVYLENYKPVYLIFDQFEELFISGSSEETEQFKKILKQLLNASFDLKVILSIREEYLAYITDFEDEIPGIFENKVRIEKMSPVKARDVVLKTCKAYGIELQNDEETAKKIIELLGSHRFGIELTYLQVLLDKLYRIAYKKNPDYIVFDDAVIAEAGTVEDVLADFLEEQLHKMEDTKLAWQILKTFVSAEGTKLTLSKQAINDTLKGRKINITQKSLNKYINAFLNIKILRLLNEEEGDFYELAHDSLAKKIYENMTSEEKLTLEVRNFLVTSYKNHLHTGGLLNKNDIFYIEPYIDKLNIDKDILQFFNKSKAHIRRKKMIMIALVSFVVLILTGITIYSLQQKAKAEKAYRDFKQAQYKININKAENAQKLPDYKTAIDYYNVAKEFIDTVDKSPKNISLIKSIDSVIDVCQQKLNKKLEFEKLLSQSDSLKNEKMYVASLNKQIQAQKTGYKDISNQIIKNWQEMKSELNKRKKDYEESEKYILSKKVEARLDSLCQLMKENNLIDSCNK